MTDDETQARQKMLASEIGKEFCDYGALIPLGRHSSFGVDGDRLEFWYDEPLCKLAWWAVGTQLDRASGGGRPIIDHAWLIGFDRPPQEPWALVTEPYIAEDTALKAIKQANQAMASWGVTWHLLPSERSSWYPGGCRPLVATFDYVDPFMRRSITWALSQLGSR